MDERGQQRRTKHRLAVLRHAEEVSGNVAATCRYYGISRPTFDEWLRQFEEFGDEGLRDRSSRPRTCPDVRPASGRDGRPVNNESAHTRAASPGRTPLRAQTWRARSTIAGRAGCAGRSDVRDVGENCRSE